MLDDWDERDEVVAAGSICPVPDCGALVISYRPSDRAGRVNAKSWCKFTCSRCGIDFNVPEDDLIFQSVPREWLLARGITSSKAMDDAEAAGRAIEVGSNFFLFFSSHLSSHGSH